MFILSVCTGAVCALLAVSAEVYATFGGKGR